VGALRRPDDVEQPAGAELADAVADGGEVGRGVAIAAVLLADDERQRVPLAPLEAGREDAQRAVALAGEPLRGELAGDPGEHRVVEALAGDVGRRERDAEARVDGGEIPRRLVDEPAPERERPLVAALEEDNATARAVRERRIRVELRARLLVEAAEVTDRLRRARLGVPEVDEVLDQHAERRPPVADVVLADDPVAERGQDARERVAEDRAAEVADVHLLRDVRRRVVDDHGLRLARRLEAEAVPLREARELRREAVVAEREVEEAWSRDGDLRAEVVEADALDDRSRHLARRPAELLRERHRDVRLVVRVRGSPQRGIGGGVLGPERFGERGLESAR
jgi:hypothetical protein